METSGVGYWFGELRRTSDEPGILTELRDERQVWGYCIQWGGEGTGIEIDDSGDNSFFGNYYKRSATFILF